MRIRANMSDLAGQTLKLILAHHTVCNTSRIRKWRDARGEQVERELGAAWSQKGPPPPGFLREKGANIALEAILTDARRGALEQARTGLTMSVLAEDWIAYGIHERDWKPSTLSDNRSVVNAHINPTLGPRRPEKITAEQIEDWRDELVEERGVSRRTANKALIVLGAILERGRKHGLVTNPAREVPKLRDRYDPNDYDFFSPEEVEKLACAAASKQDGAIIRGAAFTGSRMGELIALRWRDVDFDGESLHVYGSYSLGTLTRAEVRSRAHRPNGRTSPRHPESPQAAPERHRPRGPRLPRRAQRVPRRLGAAQALPLHARRRRPATTALSRPAPHLRLPGDQRRQHRAGPGMDGSRRHPDDDALPAPQEPHR